MSAQSMQIGQQLIGFPSLIHTETQFSQVAAQFMSISMVSVYFLTGLFTIDFFSGMIAITIPCDRQGESKRSEHKTVYDIQNP